MRQQYERLYPGLAHLGGYFHADWSLDADSPMEVLKEFAIREKAHARRSVIRDITRLLASTDDERELNRVINALSDYNPRFDTGESIRSWLISVSDVMHRSLTE